MKENQNDAEKAAKESIQSDQYQNFMQNLTNLSVDEQEKLQQSSINIANNITDQMQEIIKQPMQNDTLAIKQVFVNTIEDLSKENPELKHQFEIQLNRQNKAINNKKTLMDKVAYCIAFTCAFFKEVAKNIGVIIENAKIKIHETINPLVITAKSFGMKKQPEELTNPWKTAKSHAEQVVQRRQEARGQQMQK